MQFDWPRAVELGKADAIARDPIALSFLLAFTPSLHKPNSTCTSDHQLVLYHHGDCHAGA